LYAREDVYAPDGKKWSEKFFGTQGYAKQKDAEFGQAEGKFTAQVESLTQQLNDANAKVTELTATISGLQELVDTIPGLNERIATLSDTANKATRYRQAMKYPGLLNVAVEEEVTDAEGNTTKVVTNPLLTLLESTDLPEAELDRTLSQMAAAFSAAEQTRVEGAARTTMAPAAPVPPASSGNDIQSWAAKAQEAFERCKADYTDAQARKDYDEATQKLRELRVAQATS